MLIYNNITSFLYEYGYNGIENMYDYWASHKEEIFNEYKLTYPDRPYDEERISFEAKIRWASVFGLYARLEIEKLIRKSKGKTLLLGDVKVRYGNKYLNINDFNQETIPDRQSTDKFNITGLSVLKKNFSQLIIKDVDFSYCSLDFSSFESVSFVNCKFVETSFRDTKIKNCHFDENCLLINNDFSCAKVEGVFNCSIQNPKVKVTRNWFLLHNKTLMKSRYLRYTLILSPTFRDRCDSEVAKNYINKFI